MHGAWFMMGVHHVWRVVTTVRDNGACMVHGVDESSISGACMVHVNLRYRCVHVCIRAYAHKCVHASIFYMCACVYVWVS